MAKKKLKQTEQGSWHEQWHIRPFHVRFVDAKGNTQFLNPAFYALYPPDAEVSQFGWRRCPPQAEINLVIDATGPEGGTLDADKVITFLQQRCSVPDVEAMTWDGIVSAITKYNQLRADVPVDDADWSKPMSKSRMMDILKIDSAHTFNSYAERIGIKAVNRKLHQIRLDKMNPKDREKLEKA